MQRAEGEHAVVTGGTTGIGYSTAERLIAEGATVLITGQNAERVYEAAVFGVPHERLGEEVACVIQRKDDADLTADGLRDFLAEHLAPFKIPSRIAFSDGRLPRNPSGKILKRELREVHFGDGTRATVPAEGGSPQ